MATVISYIAADARTFNLYEFIDENPIFSAQKSTSYKIAFGESQQSVVTGVGFEFDPTFGYPTAGTTTAASTYVGGKIAAKLTGLSITTEQANQYIASNNPAAVNKDLFKGADTIVGSKFNDYLDGFGANDSITGGLGRDSLKGGTGADTFIFKTLADSTVSSTGRDTILDFRQSQGDKISVKSIDAMSSSTINEAFHFIGDNGFTKHAGELRAVISGTNTIVSGDVDGNGQADFSVLVKGIAELHATDFIL